MCRMCRWCEGEGDPRGAGCAVQEVCRRCKRCRVCMCAAGLQEVQEGQEGQMEIGYRRCAGQEGGAGEQEIAGVQVCCPGVQVCRCACLLQDEVQGVQGVVERCRRCRIDLQEVQELK